MATWHRAHAFALPLVLLLAGLTCLARPPAPSSEELVLRRQVHELQGLVAAAEGGTLVDFRQILVVVDQRLVDKLLAGVVPLEGDVGDGFHMRIRSAEAAFADGLALVNLTGEVRLVGGAASAAVAIFGGLDAIELEPESGVLRSRVKVFAVDVTEADILGVDEPARRLTRTLAKGGLESLLGPIRVPVRIADRLALPPVRARHVRVPGLDVPLEAQVSSVRVFGGKVWIGLAARFPTAAMRGCTPRTGG